MQQTTTVIQSPVMTTGYEAGRAAKRAILRELLILERARKPAPTMNQLVKVTGKSGRQARRYLLDLREAKPPMVEWIDQRGRGGARVYLTECGRGAAEIVM